MKLIVLDPEQPQSVFEIEVDDNGLITKWVQVK